MESCLYVGRVRHRRTAPVVHDFRQRLLLAYLDLGELDRVFRGRWLWSVERRTLFAFRRRDYFGDPSLPLDQAVRDEVGRRTGRRPEGPVRVLTQLRSFGFCFNPVSFYYCFGADGGDVEAILADVTNTPWNERHAYVLPREAGLRRGNRLEFESDKELHVSPFMGMDLRYRWSFDLPGERLRLRIANHATGGRFFAAWLDLERREITTAELARVALLHPFPSARAFANIYWQALRLWARRAPFFPHSQGRARAQLREAPPA